MKDLTTTANEARSVIPFGNENDKQLHFSRGFRQVADRIYPTLPDGSLLEAAEEFARDDRDKFEHVNGMPEVFESDEYKLGVVMGIYSARKRQRAEVEGARDE
jgi:hypothetical protein